MDRSAHIINIELKDCQRTVPRLIHSRRLPSLDSRVLLVADINDDGVDEVLILKGERDLAFFPLRDASESVKFASTLAPSQQICRFANGSYVAPTYGADGMLKTVLPSQQQQQQQQNQNEQQQQQQQFFPSSVNHHNDSTSTTMTLSPQHENAIGATSLDQQSAIFDSMMMSQQQQQQQIFQNPSQNQHQQQQQQQFITPLSAGWNSSLFTPHQQTQQSLIHIQLLGLPFDETCQNFTNEPGDFGSANTGTAGATATTSSTTAAVNSCYTIVGAHAVEPCVCGGGLVLILGEGYVVHIAANRLRYHPQQTQQHHQTQQQQNPSQSQSLNQSPSRGVSGYGSGGAQELPIAAAKTIQIPLSHFESIWEVPWNCCASAVEQNTFTVYVGFPCGLNLSLPLGVHYATVSSSSSTAAATTTTAQQAPQQTTTTGTITTSVNSSTHASPRHSSLQNPSPSSQQQQTQQQQQHSAAETPNQPSLFASTTITNAAATNNNNNCNNNMNVKQVQIIPASSMASAFSVGDAPLKIAPIFYGDKHAVLIATRSNVVLVDSATSFVRASFSQTLANVQLLWGLQVGCVSLEVYQAAAASMTTTGSGADPRTSWCVVTDSGSVLVFTIGSNSGEIRKREFRVIPSHSLHHLHHGQLHQGSTNEQRQAMHSADMPRFARVTFDSEDELCVIIVAGNGSITLCDKLRRAVHVSMGATGSGVSASASSLQAHQQQQQHQPQQSQSQVASTNRNLFSFGGGNGILTGRIQSVHEISPPATTTMPTTATAMGCYAGGASAGGVRHVGGGHIPHSNTRSGSASPLMASQYGSSHQLLLQSTGGYVDGCSPATAVTPMRQHHHQTTGSTRIPLSGAVGGTERGTLTTSAAMTGTTFNYASEGLLISGSGAGMRGVTSSSTDSVELLLVDNHCIRHIMLKHPRDVHASRKMAQDMWLRLNKVRNTLNSNNNTTTNSQSQNPQRSHHPHFHHQTSVIPRHVSSGALANAILCDRTWIDVLKDEKFSAQNGAGGGGGATGIAGDVFDDDDD